MEGREPGRSCWSVPSTGASVELGEHVEFRADALDDRVRGRRRRGTRPVGEPTHRGQRGDVLERHALAAIAVATHRDVEERRVAAWSARPSITVGASRITPAHESGTECRSEAADERPRSPEESSSFSLRGRLTARQARSASMPRAVRARLTSATSSAECGDAPRVRETRPAARGTPTSGPGGLACHTLHQPRRPSFTSGVPSPRAWPRRGPETLSHDVGVVVVRGRLDDRLAR